MIVQKITLTEKGLNAGPLYDIFYSTDCTNYTIAESEASLPNIGSTSNIQVADNTLCVKLVNLSPECTENEVVIDYRVTTTTTAGPTTTTTTTTAGPTTTTTTQNPAFTTTTTYAPGTFVRVVAHACQNFNDFNTYLVPASPQPAIDAVYKDAYGTCYYITSIPTGQGPNVGTLTYVGAAGSCSNGACITTTTTAAPFCSTWTVTNSSGAGYYFKYMYCGDSPNYTYPEVAANSSMSVCVQNNQIYNAFLAPLTFASGSQCFATTSTTTIPKVFTRVVAHACQDFYDFNTYGVDKAVTPNPQIGQVFKDAYGTCYYITSLPTLSGPIVGELTFVGGEGACTSSACVTTTTTEAPFCNQWKVENTSGAGYYFKYQYCGDSPNFLYPEVPAKSSVIVCTQNNRIYNSFGAPLSFTNLSSACFATTTTTTTIPPQRIFTAAPCDDIYDFHVYTTNSSSAIILGAVLKDDYGTCYQILSFNGQIPVGSLTYVGPPGDCTSPSCVTTTTTEAPFCTLWKVENLSGAGYYFKYLYCGQTDFTYPEVPANSSTIVCVQNNKIFNSFLAPLAFTALSGSCLGTTTTTTTIGPKTIFTAAPCQNQSNFFVYQADSASYAVGDVFKDGEGVCYSILSFNGQIPVGNLTFVGAAGACTSSACVTTTTTVAPYCNQWQVSNGTGAGYTFKYKYCGQTGFTYPDVPPNSSMIVCVQNDEISNPFGSPLSFVDLNTGCNATTTTTSTTTTTTLAPGCWIYDVNLSSGAAFSRTVEYVYCGNGSTYTTQSVFPGQTIQVCVDNAQIRKGTPESALMTITRTATACPTGTTTTTSTTTTTTSTTTTTLAPGCFIYDVTMTGGVFSRTVEYVYCGSGSVYTSVPVFPNTTIQLCVQDAQIRKGQPESTFMVITRTTGSCAATTTTTGGPTTTTTAGPTTTTTSTTTLPFVTTQKVVMEDCDTGGLDINTPITLAVNGTALTNGQIAYIEDGFGGYNCFTITNANYTGTTLYYAVLTSRFSTCEACLGSETTTTTTAGPTTTTTTAATTTTTTVCSNNIQCKIFDASNADGYPNLSVYYVNCDGNYVSKLVYAYTSTTICSISSLLTLRDDPNNALFNQGYPYDNNITGPYETCGVYCIPTTTTTAGPPTTTTTNAPTCNLNIEYLVIGGGGDGGNICGGGGGAGGYVSGSATLSNSGTQFPIVVGNNMQTSSLDIVPLIIAYAGGYGGGGGTQANPGGNGASGGGAGYSNDSVSVGGGIGIPGQGNNGGNNSFPAGGGGGAEQPGANGSGGGGNGGNGKLWLDGNYYAGGGGGSSCSTATGGQGGLGGGGNAGYSSFTTASAGTPNTGGGGGGHSAQPKPGGSGVVIIRYTGSPKATGGTITETGGYTYHKFTSGSAFFQLSGPSCGTTTTTTAAPTTTTTSTTTTTTTNAPQAMYTYDLAGYRSGTSYMGSDGLWVTTGDGVTGPSVCSLPFAINQGRTLNQGGICGYASWGAFDCRKVLLTAKWYPSRTYYIKYYNCSNVLTNLTITLNQNQTYNMQGVKRGTQISFWNSSFTSQIISYVWLSDNGAHTP